MSYSTVTLTGTYQLPDGSPAKGTVEIIPSEKKIIDDDGNVILSGRVKVKLDEAGKFSVALPATDDPALTPTGFGYTVAARLHHTHIAAVSFSLPAAVPTVDMTDVTQVDPSTFEPDANYVTDAELETRLADLVPDTSAIEADVTALDGRVDTVEAALPAKADDADVTALGTRVGTVEGEVTGRLSEASLSATFAPSRAAALGLRTSLAAGLSTGLAVIGDSTGNDSTEWAYLVGQALAADHPEFTVQHRLWSDAAQDLTPATTIQTGTAGIQYLDTSTSTYNRTLTASESPHTAGVLDVRIKARLASWTAPAALTLLAGRNGDAPNRSWYFGIGTTGKLSLYHSTDGTNLLTKASTVSLTTDPNTVQWVRFTYNPGVDAKFYTSADGVAWTQLGITFPHTDGAVHNAAAAYEIGGRGGGTYGASHIFEVDIRDGLNGKPIVPLLPALWGSAQGTAAAVVGAPTLTIVNGSHPGANLAYWTQARIEKANPACGQGVGFLSLSHNEAARYGPDFRARYAAVLALVKARQNGVPVVCLTQNPQAAPRDAGFITAQAVRRVDIQTAAASAGATSVDTFAAFTNTATQVMADGVHPSDAGSLVWRDAVLSALALA